MTWCKDCFRERSQTRPFRGKLGANVWAQRRSPTWEDARERQPEQREGNAKSPRESRRARGTWSLRSLSGDRGRRVEAPGQVLWALESHSEENQSGQPSGILSWRGVSSLSWAGYFSKQRNTEWGAQPTGRQLQERHLQRRTTRWLHEKTAQRLLLPLLTPFLSEVEALFPPNKSFFSKLPLCFFFFNKRSQ